MQHTIRRQDGFTMIAAIGVLFVTSLLLIAAFTVANGDVHLSHEDVTQKQAYYAALSGVQQYEYKLESNPNYWQGCEVLKNTVPEESSETYEVKVLPAHSSKGAKECEPSNPFVSAIESEGTLANTFRIQSTGHIKASGYSGSAERTIIATFQVSGFLDFIYYTNFETEDPGLYNSPKGCAGAYYKKWNTEEKLSCETIRFTTGDSVNGPMHTNDAARVEGSPTFGRKEHKGPADVIEINGGTYPSAQCEGSAEFFTAAKCAKSEANTYTTGPTIVPPESDTSLAAYVESKNEFEGVTHLVLNGKANTIAVSYYKEVKGELVKAEETINWPANGLIYVKSKACGYTYETSNSDNNFETEHEKECGTAYVSGTYSKSLTVAGQKDVIINGSLYPTSVEGSLGSAPSGTSTLGLIATEYVRVYHPCENNENQTGWLESPWIYAAILSTAHSFVVDNFACGSQLGKLHVYGAIAQNYRGIVGTGGGTGYLKDYKYDERLATDEPPYFLAPLKAGWKVARETAPSAG